MRRKSLLCRERRCFGRETILAFMSNSGQGAYQQRRVILGRPGDDFWEVLEGLNEGERVVASGNMLDRRPGAVAQRELRLRTNHRLYMIRRWR